MSVELLYTSAPSGLKQGSRGFCTVLSTQGMPVNLASRLELLSGYRHIFPPQDAQANLNPVAWSHVSLTMAGQVTSILSRIAAYGVDYSGRTNKLAHHVVVGPSERIAAGPAWLLQRPGLMRSEWGGVCETPASGPPIVPANQSARVCETWKSLTGDAGWGGVVAEALVAPAGKPLWVIYRLDQQRSLLELMNESIALLSESQRWQATFSTYYTNLPPEVDCKVRFVVEGTEEASKLASRGSSILLAPGVPLTSASAYVESARTGSSITVPAPAAPMARPAPPIDIESTWDEPENIPLHRTSKVFQPSAMLATSLPESPPVIATPPRFKGASPPAISSRQRKGSKAKIAAMVGVPLILVLLSGGGYAWYQSKPPKTIVAIAARENRADSAIAETEEGLQANHTPSAPPSPPADPPSPPADPPSPPADPPSPPADPPSPPADPPSPPADPPSPPADPPSPPADPPSPPNTGATKEGNPESDSLTRSSNIILGVLDTAKLLDDSSLNFRFSVPVKISEKPSSYNFVPMKGIDGAGKKIDKHEFKSRDSAPQAFALQEFQKWAKLDWAVLEVGSNAKLACVVDLDSLRLEGGLFIGKIGFNASSDLREFESAAQRLVNSVRQLRFYLEKNGDTDSKGFDFKLTMQFVEFLSQDASIYRKVKERLDKEQNALNELNDSLNRLGKDNQQSKDAEKIKNDIKEQQSRLDYLKAIDKSLAQVRAELAVLRKGVYLELGSIEFNANASSSGDVFGRRPKPVEIISLSLHLKLQDRK